MTVRLDRADALQAEVVHQKGVELGLTARLADSIKRGAADQEVFRFLVESVHDYAIFVLDPTGRVATWNVGAERIKGYRADEIIGRHFSTFYREDEARSGKCEMELEVAAREGRFEEEGWRVRKDGSRFWASVVISAMRGADGTLLGFSKVTRDLTDRKRVQEEQVARLAAEKRFQLLVESVGDYAIFMLDPTGHVQTWNVGAQRIKGYTASEIIGKHLSTFYPEVDVRAGKCEMELEVAGRVGRFEDEGWRLRKDGSRFWANVVISAMRDADGTLLGFAKVTRDLTERKRAEDELAARLVAERANRAKDEFLAMLGHELRNPLAPIVTALQLMKLRGDDRAAKELRIIERQVKHMMHLVDDLLDVSRIARGSVELKKQRLDVREVVAKAIEVASPLLEQRRHHFEVEVPPRAIFVEADEARLTQVFSNLLTNAAKYTEIEGHIWLTVDRRDGQAVFEVRDDGIGIDAALLPRVFDLFVQGRQSPDRSTGGLGLGLALVRTLVEIHGGRVEARSAGPGMGSTFTVRLPAVDVPALGPMPATVPPPFRTARVSRRVLVVDDNDDARMLLSDALTSVGHDVRSAADSAEALALIRTYQPDVAILDIGLPVMDGYELAARLRAELGAKVPRLVALTGYGQPHDLERSRDAGFDVHLVKPVDITRLLDSIDG